ncbi:Ig-like domain-containing protein, partial [Candidatus Zixiibacteriota bacterium]
MMRLQPKSVLLAVVLSISLVMLGLSLSCTKHRSANPVAPIQDPTMFITSLIADPPLVDAESDTSLITARLVDADGVPISGQVVQFSTNLGYVEQQAITTSAGYVSVVYVSGSQDGIAQVTAAVDDVRRSVDLQVGLGTGLLIAQPSNLLADGISVSVVTARILDENGDPRPDVPVYFYTTCGEITLSATSDGDGMATAILTSAVSTGDTAAYISVSVAQARSLVPGDVSTQRARDHGEAPGTDGVAKGLGTATDEMAKVVFRGISLTLVSEEEALSADGLSSTQLTALMTETSPPHTPVAGLPVTFASDLGDISPREVITDADGRAVTTLTSGQE